MMTSPPSTSHADLSITEKKVILYTFPPVPHAYSITPFGIKVESYLRIHKIPYEVVYTSAFGPKRKIPYVDLVTSTTSKTTSSDNDSNSSTKQIETIPDSNVIISRLNQEFDNWKLPSGETIAIHDKTLTLKQTAIGHAITRMIEEHTAIIGFYYRYVLHTEKFLNVLNVPNRLFHADISQKGAFITKMFRRGIPKSFTKKMIARGLSCHSDEELWEFSKDDLNAIESLFSDNSCSKYFFGKNHPTSMDCTLFGHLSQLLYIPMDFPQKEYLKNNCPKLIAFMTDFRTEYWSDWEGKCQRQANKQLSENGETDDKKGRLRKVIPAMTIVLVALVAKKLYYN